MKKIIILLFSFIILISTSGFCLVIKHCPATKKTSISFDYKKECCCKKKKAKKCCSLKKIVFEKIKDPSFQKAEIKIFKQTSFIAYWASKINYFDFIITTEPDQLLNYHPAYKRDIPLSILHNSLLI